MQYTEHAGQIFQVDKTNLRHRINSRNFLQL